MNDQEKTVCFEVFEAEDLLSLVAFADDIIEEAEEFEATTKEAVQSWESWGVYDFVVRYMEFGAQSDEV